MERAQLERFLEEGLSLAEIGRRLGRHESTVAYWIAKHGLEANGRERHSAEGRTRSRASSQSLVERGPLFGADRSASWSAARRRSAIGCASTGCSTVLGGTPSGVERSGAGVDAAVLAAWADYVPPGTEWRLPLREVQQRRRLKRRRRVKRILVEGGWRSVSPVRLQQMRGCARVPPRRPSRQALRVEPARCDEVDGERRAPRRASVFCSVRTATPRLRPALRR